MASPLVAELIKRFEGYRSTPYWDVNAYRTGYGSDTVTMADGSVRSVTQGMNINRADADRDLYRRLDQEFIPRARNAVGADVWDRLTENQRAALTSITYNYGSLPQSVANAFRSGDINQVASAIRGLGSHNQGINANRRNAEADIFLGQTPGDLPMGSSSGTDYAGSYTDPGQPTMTPEEREQERRLGLFDKYQEEITANREKNMLDPNTFGSNSQPKRVAQLNYLGLINGQL